MADNKKKSSAWSFWSRALTAVTGALSILAALRRVIEDSVAALLLEILDFYRRIVLAVFEPLLDLFAITTNAASENYLVYSVFLCLNLWRAALSTIDDWRSRHAMAVIALVLYLTLIWVLYFLAGNSPDRPLDPGKIYWGSMIVAMIAPVVGMMLPYVLAIPLFVLAYLCYLPLRAAGWIIVSFLGVLGVTFSTAFPERVQRLWIRAKEWLRGKLPRVTAVAQDHVDEEERRQDDFLFYTVTWRYLVGCAQGAAAAMFVYIVGFAVALP